MNHKTADDEANNIIFETDDETVSTAKERCLKFKSKKKYQQDKETENFLKTEELKEDKNINESDVETNSLTETLPQNYNKKCRKRCKTFDTIPGELVLRESHENQTELNQINAVTSVKERKLDKDQTKIALSVSLSEDVNNSKQLQKQKKTQSNESDSDLKDTRNLENDKSLNKTTLFATDASPKTERKKLKKRKEVHSNESDNDLEDKKTVGTKKLLNTSTSSEADESLKIVRKKLKKQKERHLNESGNDDEDEENEENDKNVNTFTSSATDSSPKSVRSTKISKDLQPSTISVRRSGRSPSKPIRLIEQIGIEPKTNLQESRKNLKPSSKNKELFGTDDDDDGDDYFENKGDKNNNGNKVKTVSVLETPKSKKSSSPSSSTSAIKKRKRDKYDDCEQEKRDISKWLSKKKSLESEATSSKVSKKSARSKSRSPKPSKTSKSSKESTISTPPNFNIPSKKELEEIRNKTKLTQKENEKLKAELNKMQAPPPKEVENL